MASFKVIEIVDGDTFRVAPRWKSGQYTGDIVRPTGFDTPEIGEPGYENAKQQLAALILGKQVELGRAVNFDHGRIVCDVLVNGVNLGSHFTRYR